MSKEWTQDAQKAYQIERCKEAERDFQEARARYEETQSTLSYWQSRSESNLLVAIERDLREQDDLELNREHQSQLRQSCAAARKAAIEQGKLIASPTRNPLKALPLSGLIIGFWMVGHFASAHWNIDSLILQILLALGGAAAGGIAVATWAYSIVEVDESLQPRSADILRQLSATTRSTYMQDQ